MSSNKRQKVEHTVSETASSAGAVSAIAARRRLTEVVASRTSYEADLEDPEHSLTPSNAFSALQGLQRDGLKPRERRQADKSQDGNLTSTPASIRTVQYSSFIPSKKTVKLQDDGSIHYRLPHSERLLVAGFYGIKVVAGYATIFGATVRSDDGIMWVKAPVCHALPVIRTAEKTILELHEDPSAPSFMRLGLLSPLFRQLVPQQLHEATESYNHALSSYRVIYSAEDGPRLLPVQDLISPPEWNQMLSTLSGRIGSGQALKILISGPKGSGKSTFGKLLLNRILSTAAQIETTNARDISEGVLILELDPGQPEYTPPGTLALVHVKKPNLSASFTHPGFSDGVLEIIRSHTVMSTSPASNPEHYCQCVHNLLRTASCYEPQLPLLINTPGWILGTGLDVLLNVITNANLDVLLYCSSEGPAEVVDALSQAVKHELHTMPSQLSDHSPRTAAQLRAMQTMSYFHLQHPYTRQSSSPIWNPDSLTTWRPWEVQYSGPMQGILGLLCYDYQPPLGLLHEAINGMVLALVSVENSAAFHHIAPDLTRSGGRSDKLPSVLRTPTNLPVIANPQGRTLDPEHSLLLGYVLVRGIDAEGGIMQLLTPTLSRELEDAVAANNTLVLVHGKLDCPTWAYTEDLHAGAFTSEASMVDELTGDAEGGDENSEEEGGTFSGARSDAKSSPWVQVLDRNEKRLPGSRAWRVRRDLGRGDHA